MNIRLVIDSACDVPPDLAESHNIIVVPTVLNMAEKSYRDGIDLPRAEFYARLPQFKTPPTTAAPAAGIFAEAYARCGEAHIISMHIASRLSGVFNAAQLAAQAFGKRVTLIDTEQVSMGAGWQALAAAEAIAASRSLADVLAVIESARRRVKLYALLDTVEFLRRGGRASAVAATLSELLQIKPLLEVIEGKLVPLFKLRTRQRAVEKLIELAQMLAPLERLAVLHTNSLEAAQQLAERLAGLTLQAPLIVEVTTVIGTHAGPNALGLAAIKAS